MKRTLAITLAVLVTAVSADASAKATKRRGAEVLERYHNGDRQWVFEQGTERYRRDYCHGEATRCPFIDHGEFPAISDSRETFSCSRKWCKYRAKVTYVDEIPFPSFKPEHRKAEWAVTMDRKGRVDDITIENRDNGLGFTALAVLGGGLVWFVVSLVLAIAVAVPRRAD